jgi:Lysozyme like domain
MSTSKRICAVALAFFVVVATGACGAVRRVDGGGKVPAKLTVAHVLPYAYAAGFRTEGQLATAVSIAIAESALNTHARRWHPEYGFRPRSAVIGVRGPANVWNRTHTQQINSDRGLWQISSHAWPNYSDAQTDDPARAAAIAWTISKHGTNFSPWHVYTAGLSQRHVKAPVNGYPAVLPIVRSFLASKR